MTITCGRLPCRGDFTRPPSSARPIASGAATSWATHWPVAFRRSGGGRRVLARDPASEAQLDLVDKAHKVARASGFALLGESLLAIAGWPAPPKGTKRSCPCTGLGVPGSLRSTPLIPSTLRGPAYKGHPCRRRPRPFTPLAASMPLAPLRADSIRPPERGVRRRLLVRSPANKHSVLVRLFVNLQATRTQSPFRRPSVGAAQGDARHGCRARSDGPGMALRDAPQSSAGGREVLRSKTRMLGWPSFWLLFLGHSRKSDSRSRAKPMPRRPPPMGYTPNIQSFVGWKTAKHFPRPSAHDSSALHLPESRWVSFALPTLHTVLTTVSLHARSDTTGVAPFRRPSTGCVEGQAIRHPTLSCRERHATPDRRFRQAAVNSNRTSKSPLVCA